MRLNWLTLIVSDLMLSFIFTVTVSTQSLSSENSQFREDLQLAGNEFVDEVNVGKSPYLAKGSQSPDDELPNITATVSTQQQSSPSAAITINSLPFQERLQSNGDDVSDKYKSHNGVHFAREINKTWSLRLPTKPNTSFNNRRNSVGKILFKIYLTLFNYSLFCPYVNSIYKKT